MSRSVACEIKPAGQHPLNFDEAMGGNLTIRNTAVGYPTSYDIASIGPFVDLDGIRERLRCRHRRISVR